MDCIRICLLFNYFFKYRSVGTYTKRFTNDSRLDSNMWFIFYLFLLFLAMNNNVAQCLYIFFITFFCFLLQSFQRRSLPFSSIDYWETASMLLWWQNFCSCWSPSTSGEDTIVVHVWIILQCPCIAECIVEILYEWSFF